MTEVWNITGDLDPDLFIKSLELVGKRQQLLRTTFKLEDEKIICSVNDEFKYQYEYVDLSNDGVEDVNGEFDSIARRVSQTIFDLANGPLLNVVICRRNNNEHSIVINIHHIISDKWSMRLMRKELSEIYSLLKSDGEAELTPLESQYSEYAEEQLTKKANPDSISYWKNNLQGLDQNVSLPSVKAESRNKSLAGKYSRKKFPSDLDEKVLEFCKLEKVTPFIFFLTIFKTVIHKYTSLDDIVVGTPISTRSKDCLLYTSPSPRDRG